MNHTPLEDRVHDALHRRVDPLQHAPLTVTDVRRRAGRIRRRRRAVAGAAVAAALAVAVPVGIGLGSPAQRGATSQRVRSIWRQASIPTASVPHPGAAHSATGVATATSSATARPGPVARRADEVLPGMVRRASTASRGGPNSPPTDGVEPTRAAADLP